MTRHLMLACAIAFGSFGLASAQSSATVHPAAVTVYDSMRATAVAPSLGRLAERTAAPVIAGANVIIATGPAIVLPMPR
jgi:hypothetical protein